MLPILSDNERIVPIGTECQIGNGESVLPRVYFDLYLGRHAGKDGMTCRLQSNLYLIRNNTRTLNGSGVDEVNHTFEHLFRKSIERNGGLLPFLYMDHIHLVELHGDNEVIRILQNNVLRLVGIREEIITHLEINPADNAVKWCAQLD